MLLTLSSIYAENEPNISNIEKYTAVIEKDPTRSEFKTLLAYLERANCHMVRGNLLDAKEDFDHICFTIIPKDKNVYEEVKKMPQERLYLFCDALRGRIQTYHKIDALHKKSIEVETRLLVEIDTRIPKVVEVGEDEYIMPNTQLDDKEMEEFTDNLKKQGLISKSADVEKLPSGYIKVKTQPAKPSCCTSCKDGRKCKDEKKSLN